MLDNNTVAIKIRRIDSKHNTLYNEANMLKLANTINVGPKLIYASRDIIVMEYIDGIHIKDLLNKDRDIKYIIKDVILQCFILDLIGLDHGELYRMDKHVIVNDNNIKIIDFDSASINRNVKNVTSATQYFLINAKLNIDREELFNALRDYKRCICLPCLNVILSFLKVK